MTRWRDIFQCTVCGHIIEVIRKGNAALFCCGRPMERLNEKSIELGHEQHLPVLKNTAEGVIIRVGEIPHPMTEEHHIVFIELLTDSHAYRMDLPPDGEPLAFFSPGEDIVGVRAYCNLHGLWGQEL